MSEFRTGNKGRSHPYPATPRGGASAITAFARNFAVGPSEDQEIAAAPGTQIEWGTVDVAGFTFFDVPITPRSTGIILVSGVVTVANDAANPVNVQLQIQIQGVTQLIPLSELVTVDTQVDEVVNAYEAIPFVMRFTGLAIGVLQNIQILLIASEASAITLPANSSSVEVQEVAAATG